MTCPAASTEGGATEGESPILLHKIGIPESVDDVVLSSSQLYVANPLYKAPSSGGREREILLDIIPETYVPSTYFARNVTEEEFILLQPKCKWDRLVPHSKHFRIAFRKMLSGPTERTLIAALIPEGVAHIDFISSLVFKDEDKLVKSYPLG